MLAPLPLTAAFSLPVNHSLINASFPLRRYQHELPKKIKSRGKDAHLTHEEMVQTIKWKLAVRHSNACDLPPFSVTFK